MRSHLWEFLVAAWLLASVAPLIITLLGVLFA
jgi:hypothetical protein